ncbi:hypothetical protein NUW58_g1673 [Xylaria curta]|uniref:Uncharacterized protein n=1 Tax=Xylaria curta TaxID=42375 RepID=A0ACC1PL74_9PEZI|nr:hypothetical protein NUW58_g1673 [Xylaria curta]
MDSLDLEQLFQSQWKRKICICRQSLEPHDLDSVDLLISWDVVRETILDGPGVCGPSELALAKPALGHVNAFTNIFETELGPNLSAAFLWGVIGILLQVSSQSVAATQTTLRILRSIGYKAGTFNSCRATLPHIVNQIKEACFDIHMELVEFCVDAIKCLRGDHESDKTYKHFNHFAASHHLGKRQDGPMGPIEQLERRYASMNIELEKTLVQVEKLVQFSLSVDIHTKPGNAVSQTLQTIPDRHPTFLLLPQTRTLRFFDREDIFEKLDTIFGDELQTPFKSVALWGLGGIGKSSIALQYIERKVAKDEYHAMFWVNSEKDASIRQSFTDIALKLKLPGARPQTHDENMDLVQDWLQSTDTRWLLVYDNVPELSVLTRHWPVAGRGHVIITTRSSSVAFRQASAAIEVKSWDARLGSQFLMFLLQNEIGRDLEKEGISAQELSHRLGGHTLGISHMAGLIHRRSLTISEFMKVYLNNVRRVHGSELQALWGFSFKALNPQACAFLSVLSFLTPDHIPQSFFEIKDQLPKGLAFCSDDLSFSETIEGLLEVSLIKRNRDNRTFSIHRMVQTQFRYFLEHSQLQSSFEDVVALIYHQFPKMGDEKGQLYDEWAQCNSLLQHIISLKDCFRACHNHNKNFKAPWRFCELLKDCQRYLYESNAFQDLEDMCNVNLIAVGTLSDRKRVNDLLPHIYSQQANMSEGLGDAEEAIKLNKKGYEIRLREDPINHRLCYGFEANMGYTYNTANEHSVSMQWLEKAGKRWVQFVDKSGDENSYPTVLKKNMARCLFHMGKVPEAKLLLDSAIAEFRVAKPFNWGMMAYAYQILGLIQRKEGNLEASEASLIEAQNLWRRGDQARLNPFYGGCVYKTGVVCLDQGKTEAAVKHLRDSLDITGFHKERMPAEHARSCFKLSEALYQDNPYDTNAADELRKDAEIYLKKRNQNATDFSSEAGYDKYVPIFWR